jgi:hypothetical protein
MTKRQREILQMLSDGRKWRESDIKARWDTLCDMAHRDWLDGAFDSNLGRTPKDRVWWITPPGRKALEEAAG